MPAKSEKQNTVTEYSNEKVSIWVDKKLCKACDICVVYCPTKVLAMEGSVVVAKDIDACTACMLCELRCPDFAIWVEKKKGAKKNE